VTESDGETAKRGPGRPPKTSINPAKAAALVDEMLAAPDKPTTPPVMPEPVAQSVKLIPVRLLKHYRPSGAYEIVDEAPPPLPGVAFATKDKAGKETGRKIWADSVVKLPVEEARRLLDNYAESSEAALGPDGKPNRNARGDVIRHLVRRKFPLAERADPLPV
jgi:hypothetical protein